MGEEDMREVPKDDKWTSGAEYTERELKARYEALKEESKRTTAPRESELALIGLLMRIYDVNMAILSNINKPEADALYEAHERGEILNPDLFIPSFESTETES